MSTSITLQAEHTEYLEERRRLSPSERWSKRPQATFEKPHTCAFCRRLRFEEEETSLQGQRKFVLETRGNLASAIVAAKHGCDLFVWLVDQGLYEDLSYFDDTVTFHFEGFLDAHSIRMEDNHQRFDTFALKRSKSAKKNGMIDLGALVAITPNGMDILSRRSRTSEITYKDVPVVKITRLHPLLDVALMN
jgi:hypothetical protein